MPDNELQELSREDCERQLAVNQVGRLAFVADGMPVVLPINYRWVQGTPPLVVVRARPGGAIETADRSVAFEIDGVDPVHRTGWSVLVQGRLVLLTDEVVERYREAIDPHTWLTTDRDAWLALIPTQVSGRRLHAPEAAWSVHLSAYL
jgi:uncharacterized protein